MVAPVRISNPLMANLIPSGDVLASFPVPFLKRENKYINSGLCSAVICFFYCGYLYSPHKFIKSIFSIVWFPLNKPCTCDLSMT